MISVIISLFNRAKNLDFVLASLERQTNKDFEVIISDDGSDDNWDEIIEKYSTLKIKTLTGKHDGNRVSRARNRGAKVAKGDLLLFLDSDIMLCPKAIEEYYRLINIYPMVILGRYDWLPEGYEINLDKWNAMVGASIPDHRKLKEEQVIDDSGGAILTGNILVPAYVFEKVGFDEKIVWGGEDCDFGFNLHRHGFKAIYSMKPLGLHIWHKEIRRDEIKTIEYLHNVKYPERGKLNKEELKKLAKEIEKARIIKGI